MRIRVEAKCFTFSGGRNVDYIRISEEGRRWRETLEVSLEEGLWLAQSVRRLHGSGPEVTFVRKAFRDTVIAIQVQENRQGIFLCISTHIREGKPKSIRVPAGLKGIRWLDFIEGLEDSVELGRRVLDGSGKNHNVARNKGPAREEAPAMEGQNMEKRVVWVRLRGLIEKYWFPEMIQKIKELIGNVESIIPVHSKDPLLLASVDTIQKTIPRNVTVMVRGGPCKIVVEEIPFPFGLEGIGSGPASPAKASEPRGNYRGGKAVRREVGPETSFNGRGAVL